MAPGLRLPARGRRDGHGERQRDASARRRRRRQLRHRDAATPSANGVDISVPRADSRANLVGAPRLELDYGAQGTRSSTQVYAQIVDVERDIVIGGQVTPIPLELDHQPHTLNLSPSRSPTRCRRHRG